jgi:hypothetical protein
MTSQLAPWEWNGKNSPGSTNPESNRDLTFRNLFSFNGLSRAESP